MQTSTQGDSKTKMTSPAKPWETGAAATAGGSLPTGASGRAAPPPVPRRNQIGKTVQQMSVEQVIGEGGRGGRRGGEGRGIISSAADLQWTRRVL